MLPATARPVAAGVTLAVIVAAGLVVHGVLPDSAATDIAGDALYAVAVYAGVALVTPRLHPPLVATIAAAWCVSVELFQLTGVPLAAGASFPPLALVLGSGFDVRDLVVYIAAAAAAVVIDLTVARGGARGLPDGRRTPTMEQ